MKLLYFSAPWCGPCKALAPVLEKIGQTHTVDKINVDEQFELAQKFNIRSVPTVVLINEAEQELERSSGPKPEAFYLELFEKHSN
jgi:thioredoxin-like negative regulator of GroEL